MPDYVVLLSVPGLREKDLAHMPRLAALTSGGDRAPIAASFPAVTCPVQVNMTTGVPPEEHGVIANGFYWRDGLTSGRGPKTNGVEMWTAWDDVVQQPRIWDRLREHNPALTSAVWFPLLAKGCGAEYVATFAPIHNPDGSESLWCYTKPEAMYGELRDALGHFPLKHFWGPLAGIESTRWIIDSLLWLLERELPRFSYIYLPHLDYAAQKFGPDSSEAVAACEKLDAELGRLFEGYRQRLGEAPLWLVASEYAITPVSHVSYPNRVLRDAGLLAVRIDNEGREQLDYSASDAWALVDHQHSHVFVRDRNATIIKQVAKLFQDAEGIAEGIGADRQKKLGVRHERSGDLLLVSEPHSWQAYYWWNDDALAPLYARTIDIHRKPGYDPIEMFYNPALAPTHGSKGHGSKGHGGKGHGGGTPLDATLARGSHGAPPVTDAQRGVILSSEQGVFVERLMADIDVCQLVLQQFGV